MLKLRDYQNEAIETVNALPEGSRSIVCLATGLGKTVVAANFNFGGRVLWLSHRDELVRQPERYFKDRGLSYGIEKADEHENGEDVVSASVQTLYRDDRLHRFSPDAFDTVICDEAQHAAAKSYRKILSYFKPKKLIGLTATPQRGDGVRLTDVFDDICFVRDLRWGIKHNYLSPIRCIQIAAGYNMDKVDRSMGDFSLSGLEHEMSGSDTPVVVAKAYEEYCLPEKKKTLIYCPTVKVCHEVKTAMENRFSEEISSRIAVLSDSVPADERRKMLDDYSGDKLDCIINCMILTEGTDLPDTSVIINNRPSANATLYQQIVGRGTRLAEGKEYCLVIDVLGENYRAKNICTAPTLFGLDPDLLPDAVVSDLQGKDLLECSEEIEEQQNVSNQNFELLKKMIDIFATTREDLVTDHAERGFQAIADAYNHTLLSEIPEEYDFGSLVVKRMPDNMHYFSVAATFKGYVYFSKPDMLDKTIVTVDIPDVSIPGYGISKCHSKPMPIQDAVSFTENMLKYAIPESYGCKWSRDIRQIMNKISATDKQKYRIVSDYRGYGVRDDARLLTRLQAADLIDLINEIRESDLKKKTLRPTKPVKKPENLKGKRLERWVNEQKALQKEQDQSDRMKVVAFEKLEEKVKEIKRQREKEERALIAKEESLAKKTQVIQIKMDYSYYRKDPNPSEKQISYIKDLEAAAKKRGIIYDIQTDPRKLHLDMWHTGFLINALIQINQNLPVFRNHTARINLRQYIDAVRKIKKPVGSPFYSVSYKLKSN